MAYNLLLRPPGQRSVGNYLQVLFIDVYDRGAGGSRPVTSNQARGLENLTHLSSPCLSVHSPASLGSVTRVEEPSLPIEQDINHTASPSDLWLVIFLSGVRSSVWGDSDRKGSFSLQDTGLRWPPPPPAWTRPRQMWAPSLICVRWWAARRSPSYSMSNRVWLYNFLSLPALLIRYHKVGIKV